MRHQANDYLMLLLGHLEVTGSNIPEGNHKPLRFECPVIGTFLYSINLCIAMRIDGCPKNLKDCPGKMCPLYPCWAVEDYLNKQDRNKRNKDEGWE